MFQTKPLKSKPQPYIQAVYRYFLKKPGLIACLNKPDIGLNIFEIKNQEFITKAVFFKFAVPAFINRNIEIY